MTVAVDRIQSVFAAAAGLTDPAARVALLDRECGHDAELRRRVEHLLKAHDDSGGLPAAGPPPTALFDAGVHQGAVVAGRYQLLELVGEGGMGTVWLAEQTEPVKRKVALKLVKPGMDSKAVLARFEAERQALALMDHPNIAKVLDGGVTDQGRPYFVMELVKGLPLTEYCDARRLSIRERLDLFVPICAAVQHAHQKGIIHRDLKPSNILVEDHDGKPVPKVIDFGLAKALSAATTLTERTLHTAFDMVAGTPPYMAPEQVGHNALDVDTRTDVYALGVILYELLTGTTPLERKRFKEAAWDEIRRVIREEEPPKPSSRLQDSRDSLPSISAQRHTEPSALTRLVRGELDWIAMKALEKDRNRRYESANGLAMDVQRYLADEPVQACPPSGWYRFKKFVRRNKGSVAVAGVLGLAALIAVGAVAGSMGWAARVRAERQVKAASQIELIVDEVERLEREQKWPEALATARRAEAVIASGEVDDATRQRVDELLKDLTFIDRLEQARMTAATWVVSAFDFDGADRDYARAFREYGVDVDELPIESSISRLAARPSIAIPLATALDNWAQMRWRSKGDVASKRRLVSVASGIDSNPLRNRLRSVADRPASEVGEEIRQLATSIDIRSELPATLIILCQELLLAKELDLAQRILREAQRAHPEDFWLNLTLADVGMSQKDAEGAVRFYTAAVSIRPRSIAALNNLGLTLARRKKLDEAIAYYHRAIEIDPNQPNPFVNLGILLCAQKKLDEAEGANRKAIEISPKHAKAYVGLGSVFWKQKKQDEAMAAYRKAIELNPKDVEAYRALGEAFWIQKKPDEAADAYRKAAEAAPTEALAHKSLGEAFWMQKKPDQAIAAYRKAIELDPKDVAVYRSLAGALGHLGRSSEVIAVYRKVIELEPKDATSHISLAWNLATCADAKLRNPNEAVAIARKAIELDSGHTGFPRVLGEACYRANEWRAAIAAFEKSMRLNQGGDIKEWLFTAMAHWQLGDKAKAREWFDRAAVQMDKQKPQSERLSRLRKEAADLLGVNEKKD